MTASPPPNITVAASISVWNCSHHNPPPTITEEEAVSQSVGPLE